MANDPTSDLDVENNVVFEYGQAMATAAESLLRYPDRMQMARSETERAYIRKCHAEILKRTIYAHRIAFAAMTAQTRKENETMKNVMGILKVVGAGAAAALGVLAVPFTAGTSITATVAVIAAVTGLSATGAAAGALYHESPAAAK